MFFTWFNLPLCLSYLFNKSSESFYILLCCCLNVIHQPVSLLFGILFLFDVSWSLHHLPSSKYFLVFFSLSLLTVWMKWDFSEENAISSYGIIYFATNEYCIHTNYYLFAASYRWLPFIFIFIFLLFSFACKHTNMYVIHIPDFITIFLAYWYGSTDTHTQQNTDCGTGLTVGIFIFYYKKKKRFGTERLKYEQLV